MITIRNLTKTYDRSVEILSSISVMVDDNDFVAILGASGSGKSTLLHCISLRESWSQGQFIMDGKDLMKVGLWEKWQHRRQWAYMAEKPELNIHTSAIRNVMGGRIQHTPLWRILTRSVAGDEYTLGMDFLEKVGLLDKAQEKVGKLSGGEQQRVALARALVKGARRIAADEPTKGLDPTAAEKVMDDFKKINQGQGVTIFCALNQIELAEKYATRIWILAEGKIVLDIPGRRLTMLEKRLIK